MRVLILLILLAGCSAPGDVAEQSNPTQDPPIYRYQNVTEQFAGNLGQAVAEPATGLRAGSSLVGQMVIPANTSSAIAYLNFSTESTVNSIRLAVCPSPCANGDANAICSGSSSSSFTLTFPITQATGFRIMVNDGASTSQPVTLDVAYKEALVDDCAVASVA